MRETARENIIKMKFARSQQKYVLKLAIYIILSVEFDFDTPKSYSFDIMNISRLRPHIWTENVSGEVEIVYIANFWIA